MEAVRFLTRLRVAIAVGVLALAAPTMRADDKPAAMPRWVKLSLVSASATELSWKATGAVENFDRVSTLEPFKNVGDIAMTVRHLVRQNSALIGRGSSGGARSLAKIGLLTAGWAVYDLSTGQMTVREAGKMTTQVAASAAVGALVPATMMWVGASVLGATASTGTAIATLSGAAYTSAATAWLGGGAVSAGGGGVAIGSTVLTAGAVLVAVAVGVTVSKVWNMADPAEREGVKRYVDGLLQRADLTDGNTEQGMKIQAESRDLENAKRLRDLK